MTEKHKERSKMTWLIMDICDMKDFETDSFDLIIDKSTMDALCCGDDSLLKIALMLKEQIRVLKTDAHYFCISYGKPEARLQHFEQVFLSWDIREFILYDSNIESEEEKNEKCHYIYVCKVNDDANEISEKYFAKAYELLKVDNDIQKEVERQYGQEDDSDEDADDGKQRQE